MNIQEFLTYFINTFVLSSIIFFLLDFYFYLLNCLGARSLASYADAGSHRSWQQLNPSTTKPDFYASCSSTETAKTALAYQQVKDIFRDAPALVIAT